MSDVPPLSTPAVRSRPASRAGRLAASTGSGGLPVLELPSAASDQLA